MTWFAFANGHPDIDAAGAEEKLLVSDGFHGYATQKQADAHPNLVNAAQEVSLAAWDSAHAVRVGTGAAGGSAADKQTAQKNVTNSLTGSLSKLPWLRVAEVVLGILLISVGIAKMTDAVPAATKIAGYVI